MMIKIASLLRITKQGAQITQETSVCLNVFVGNRITNDITNISSSSYNIINPFAMKAVGQIQDVTDDGFMIIVDCLS